MIDRFRPLLTAVKYAAVIGHHDSYFKTDLTTGQRTNWDEVLKAATAPKRR